MSIEISVIVTAYDRPQYLVECLSSVLNQTMERDSYEIIIVKNFPDKEIDEFVEKHDIVNIRSNGTIGEFYVKGIEKSKGKILCFLDDDDLFERNKLQEVYSAFRQHDICYLRNTPYIFTENRVLSAEIESGLNEEEILIHPKNEKLEHVLRVIRDKKYFNISSVSVFKSTIQPYFDSLKRLKSSTDQFVFYLCISIGCNMLFTDRPLSKYRIHESTSITETLDESSIKRLNSDWTNAVDSFNLMLGNFPPSRYTSIINLVRQHFKAMSYFTGNDSNLLDLDELLSLLKGFVVYRGIYSLSFSAIVCLSSISKHLAKMIYTKGLSTFTSLP